jgi:hypothetical protein
MRLFIRILAIVISRVKVIEIAKKLLIKVK